MLESDLTTACFHDRWGLHLVPENLSAVLADFPRVDSMYDTGAPFSLDVLIGQWLLSVPPLPVLSGRTHPSAQTLKRLGFTILWLGPYATRQRLSTPRGRTSSAASTSTGPRSPPRIHPPAARAALPSTCGQAQRFG